MSKQLAKIHALWIGNKLGPIARCCLRSFVMRGHDVTLHSYNAIEDIPEGVESQDANLIIPKERIVKHKATGSYALFSDLFRYELLQKLDNNTLYVDCDVYCLKPITIPDNGYLLSYEDDNAINGAVLALPQNSPILNALISASKDPKFIPPWYPNMRRFKLRISKYLGFKRKIEEMAWGVIGPTAITYYAHSFQELDKISSIDLFYPVHYKKVRQYLLDGDLSLEDVVTHRTLCIHLYNEKLKDICLETIDKRSVLNRLLQNEV